MHTQRAAYRTVTGILCGLLVANCGGGSSGSGYSGTSNMLPPATVSVTANPTSVTVGQSATISWTSSPGTTCTASGAWAGALAASGSQSVTPTAAATDTYTLNCTGGSYSNGTGSASLTVGAVSVSKVYSLTDLVADVAGGTAANTDKNLVNPWGVSIPSGTVLSWVANNGSQTSTLYDGDGKPQPAGAPLVVTFAGTFGPTGVVYNGSSTSFLVTSGANTGAASFIFAGESGSIAGWAESVNLTQAITVYTDTGGAVYKGLALAPNAGSAYLYATDFHNGKIDVFNASFAKQATSASAFTFADPSIPAGYAPFGIQAIANGSGGTTQIYVTYAQQLAPNNVDNATGAGLGYVDIYTTNGQLIKHLIAGGALNAPWGLALAPSDFGSLSNQLLVGNFGDGKVNAYDPAAGTLTGTVSDASAKPIATPGLWGIAFGNDAYNQPHNTLFFAAGTNGGVDGTYGRIDLGATAPLLNQSPVVTITSPLPNAGGGYGGGGTKSLSGTVAVTATVTDSLAITKVQFFANGSTLIGTATTAPYTVQWNTADVANGSVTLTATATDADGNTGTSPKDTISVSNAAPAPAATLSQLQAQIFTPICSGCHTGVGANLPGVQNLTSAAASYAALVNVPAIEQPAVELVKPGDPTASYLIEKLEGAAGISGSRMPLGGPYLSTAQIDLIESWITAGAQNN